MSLRAGRLRFARRGLSARFGPVRIGTRWPGSTGASKPRSPHDEESASEDETPAFIANFAASTASEGEKERALDDAVGRAAAFLGTGEVAAIEGLSDDQAELELAAELEVLRVTDPYAYARLLAALPADQALAPPAASIDAAASVRELEQAEERLFAIEQRLTREMYEAMDADDQATSKTLSMKLEEIRQSRDALAQRIKPLRGY
jgi:hypothetical protein